FQEPHGDTEADIIFLTHEAREGDIDSALQRIGVLAFVHSDVTRLRMEHLIRNTDPPVAACRRKHSPTSCSKAWRPMAAWRCPNAFPPSTPTPWKPGGRCRMPNWPLRSWVCTSTTSLGTTYCP